MSADSKIRTLPQRATGNAHPRNRRPASKTAGANRPPEMRPQRHRLAATRSASGTYPQQKKSLPGLFLFYLFIDIDFVRSLSYPDRAPDLPARCANPGSKVPAARPSQDRRSAPRSRPARRKSDIMRNGNTAHSFSRRAGRQYRGCPARPGRHRRRRPK